MWGNMGNITELERNSNNRSMRDLYTGVNGFKDVYQPKSKLLEDNTGTCLQIPTIFWIGGWIISVSYWVYTYIWHTVIKPRVLEAKMATADLKRTTCQTAMALSFVCSSHLKNPVQQAFHWVIALLGSGISRKHTADFDFCEGYQTEYSPETGWWHELMVMWLSRQDLRATRLFWGNKTLSNVWNSLTLGSDFLENT